MPRIIIIIFIDSSAIKTKTTFESESLDFASVLQWGEPSNHPGSDTDIPGQNM